MTRETTALVGFLLAVFAGPDIVRIGGVVLMILAFTHRTDAEP